jgi:hypothetical protein
MGWEDYLGVDLSPGEVQELYENKTFKGVVSDPLYTVPFREAVPSFYQVFPTSIGAGAGRLCLPYLAALEFDSGYGGSENQTTGDCVSHDTRNAGMLDYCIDAIMGETSYEGRLATENIYGARGHGGQGASCDRLAGYVSKSGKGGFLTRKEYTSSGKSVDLSVYNSRIGHNWGPSGTPAWINDFAATNKAFIVLKVESLEEERDAIATGFGVSACSGLSFQNERNGDGVSLRTPQGWNHAMAHIGFDDRDATRQKYQGSLVLIQNSWGLWNSGPKVNDQPDGSFWTPGKYSDQMSRYVIGSLAGYKRQVFNYMESRGWVR